AFDHFLVLPQNGDISKYKISQDEWQQMKDFEIILDKPHKVQQFMSSESTPVLSGAIPSFEMFMTSWENLAERNSHLQPLIQPGLDVAYKY
ncbi:hypothetical protein EI94DRAFT_1584030, partial [Lactarius quietus]